MLNNLTDITLEPAFSAICGYTERDLDMVFAPELGALDRQQVRQWYNGYGWLGFEKVYNPYDVLLLFATAAIRGVLVRDRDARVSGGHSVQATGVDGVAGRDGEHGGIAVGVRRGARRHRWRCCSRPAI